MSSFLRFISLQGYKINLMCSKFMVWFIFKIGGNDIFEVHRLISEYSNILFIFAEKNEDMPMIRFILEDFDLRSDYEIRHRAFK